MMGTLKTTGCLLVLAQGSGRLDVRLEPGDVRDYLGAPVRPVRTARGDTLHIMC